jgi:hypothetical protein
MRKRRLVPEFDETRIEHRLIDGRPADVYEAIRYRPGKHEAEPRRSTGRVRMPVRLIGTGFALLSAAATAYFRFLRPWHMNWGATETEASGEVAGDELMRGAGIVSTRAVEIAASPSAIWPWLVQMGPGRGGAYTYDWIERRLGIDIRNVDRIVPELQDLKVGDEIDMPGYKMRVERLDRERAMVVRSSNGAWLWAFELRPTNSHTRLISRNSFDTSALRLQDWLAYPVIEPGSWVMERKMLLTIKQRAESLAGSQPRPGSTDAGTGQQSTAPR